MKIMLIVMITIIASTSMYGITNTTLTSALVLNEFLKTPGVDDACPLEGSGCLIKVKDIAGVSGTAEVVAHPNGGYLLTQQISLVTVSIDEQQTWVTSSDQTMTFKSTDYIVITNSDEFPELENKTVYLTGVSTDSQGNFTVYISPVN